MLYNRKSPSGYTYGRKIELHPKSFCPTFGVQFNILAQALFIPYFLYCRRTVPRI